MTDYVERKYLEDRLLDYANLFEQTARLIKNGEVYSNEKVKRMKRFIALIDEHKFLDTPEVAV